MSALPAPATAALDQPLPDTLAGRGQGWLSAYRRWPVFSPMWLRGRLKTFGFWLGLFLLPVAAGVYTAAPDERPWPGLAQMAVELLLPLLLGPWLGLQVRRRGWPPAREWAGLCAAVAVTVGLVMAFHLLGAEPMKQAVAAQLGLLDAEGRRPRAAMSIGINVGRSDRPDSPAREGAAAATSRLAADPGVQAFNAALRGVLAFCFAGGFALVGWRREQRELAALQREQALAEAQARQREAELRLSVLAAQVEPHFLFNTLAGVRSAIATDPARASVMIDHLVDYLRASIPRLRADGAADATLGGQLEQVRAYLGLMSARMPRLQVAVQAPPALLAARCPPLMLISLAENAVKHGVEPKMGAARIEVGAEALADGSLAITVADDGVGFGHGVAGTGIGLANIRERLAQLYGGRAALTLKAREGGGVAATLSLPLELPGPTAPRG